MAHPNFEKWPAQEPLTSLRAIVNDWTYRYGASGPQRMARDRVVAYCAEAYTLSGAIQRACDSRCAKGKQHNHQSRVPSRVRAAYAKNLTAHIVRDACKNFDELFDICEAMAVPGIGPVTIYDVATRIGAYLKLEPESLYLHAGVLVGWCALTNTLPVYWRDKKRILMCDLPKQLQRLPADEIEDMLCAYRAIIISNNVKIDGASDESRRITLQDDPSLSRLHRSH